MKQSVQKDKKALERYRKLVRQIQEQTEINLFETPEEQKARIKRLLGNYEEFVEYYFPHYASSKCASFHIKLANMVKRDPFIALLLAWARGLAKSTHCDILIPLWLWCNGMLRVMLLVGQTEEKAKKLLGDLQAELEGNQRLKNDFGDQLGGGNWQEGNFITANDCAFFAIAWASLRAVLVISSFDLITLSVMTLIQNKYARTLNVSASMPTGYVKT